MENNGDGKLIWCKGVVTGVMNKKNKVRIKWDEEYHKIGYPETIEETSMKTKLY